MQVGAFPGERAAWQVAEESARLAPEGQPRVQPIVYGRRTLYHAQLLGLSEAEARNRRAGTATSAGAFPGARFSAPGARCGTNPPKVDERAEAATLARQK